MTRCPCVSVAYFTLYICPTDRSLINHCIHSNWTTFSETDAITFAINLVVACLSLCLSSLSTMTLIPQGSRHLNPMSIYRQHLMLHMRKRYLMI